MYIKDYHIIAVGYSTNKFYILNQSQWPIVKLHSVVHLNSITLFICCWCLLLLLLFSNSVFLVTLAGGSTIHMFEYYTTVIYIIHILHFSYLSISHFIVHSVKYIYTHVHLNFNGKISIGVSVTFFLSVERMFSLHYTISVRVWVYVRS